MKEENKKFKIIDGLKKYDEYKTPNNIKLLSNVVNDSYAFWTTDNSFTVFKSINDIIYLIYANKNKSIIAFDLNEQKKIIELKNPHNEYIANFRHCLDTINKRDLIMSISSKDNNIKIWNVNNWECILKLTNVNNDGYLFSACFFNKKEEIFIISSNNNIGITEPIKVFDLNGQKIKEINYSNKSISYIDTYYDINLFNYYIVTGNFCFSQSYDYMENKIYQKYKDNLEYDNSFIIIISIDIIVAFVISCSDGYIRIFNFHTGFLLNKIEISNTYLFEICPWDDNYLFIACEDKTIKIVDLKAGILFKSLTGHNNEVLTIKKIIHPKYGICLISQNWHESYIKLWINDI